MDGIKLTQSLAICEFLDERYPDPPLLPADPTERAAARAFALAIASDIHPLQNLRTLKRLRAFGLSKEQISDWAMQVIGEGFDVCETLAACTSGRFTFGDCVTLADIALTPQPSNARRYWTELRWPALAAIETECLSLEAFRNAAPATP